MQATFNLVTNPFHPLQDRVQRKIKGSHTVASLVKSNKVDLSRPTICYYNGKPLLRKEWEATRIQKKDVVTFIYLPQGGGGGSNVLRVVLMIAVIAFAAWAGPAAAGALGMTGTTATIAGGAFAAGISMAGSMLVNALIPPPKPPSMGGSGSVPTASPTYSLQAQGNQARIGAPVPVIYGRHMVYPDFAAMPYVEYQDNDQYLYQLFCVGQGEYEFNEGKFKIENSPFSAFEGITYQIVNPGEKVTLFPTNVVTAPEVSGQELLTADEVGPFPVNAPETQIDKIAIDVVLPRGLYYANDGGGLSNVTVKFRFIATEIDDYGLPVSGGDVIAFAEETITGATTTAIRRTFKYNVPPGRYRVHGYRTNAKQTGSRYGNDVNWYSLRGYIVGGKDTYPGMSLLAVKMLATDNISQQSSRKINIEVIRKLRVPSWDASSGSYVWSAPVATRSAAWAIADMTLAKYGAGVPDYRLDIGQLIQLNSIGDARGDCFDAVFDGVQTYWDALSAVARSVRAKPFIQSGVLHFVRDQLQTLPTAMFTSRNIVQNSFKITYVMPSEDSADCVEVEYFDNKVWKNRTIKCAVDGHTADKPAQVKAFGITNRDHAWREGMYMAYANKYRRKEISFETELEGHIPSLGDLIAVQSDIPEWGEAGEVVNIFGRTLTLSEPVTWTAGADHFIMLRRRDGSAWGPVKVTKGASENTAVMDAASAPDFSVNTGFDMERTFYSFGRAGQVVHLARITSIRPRTNTVQINCVNEDIRVHSADGGVVPIDDMKWSLSTPSVRPTLKDINIVQTGSGKTPSLTVSWDSVPGASRYIVQLSYDNENWSSLAEVVSCSYSFIANRGTVYIRVAAFGGARGPWVTKSIEVGLVPPPPDVTAGTVRSDGPSFEFKWTAVPEVDDYVLEIEVGGYVKRETTSVATSYRYTWEMAYADGGPWRSVTFKIKARKGSITSQNWHSVSASNPAPAAPTCVVKSGVKSLAVEVSVCREPDYMGTIIWGSTQQNFVPSDLNKLYEGSNTFFMVSGITDGMYFLAAHYDTYGRTGLNLSGYAYGEPSTVAGVTTVIELPADPSLVEGQQAIYLDVEDEDQRGLYGWDGTKWVSVNELKPGSVTSMELAAGAVDYTKLAAGAVQARNLAVKKHFLY